MSNFVISYDREDTDFVNRLADVMAKQEHDVWYDREIDYGEPFSRVIQREIDRADEVIVLWSPASIESSWVENEAAYALSQEKIRPACINGLAVTEVPLGFFGLNTFVFEDDDPAYLKSAVRRFVRNKALGTGRGSKKAAKARESAKVDRRGINLWAALLGFPLFFGGGAVVGDQFGTNARGANGLELRLDGLISEKQELENRLDQIESDFIEEIHEIQGKSSEVTRLRQALMGYYTKTFPGSTKFEESLDNKKLANQRAEKLEDAQNPKQDILEKSGEPDE